MDIKRAIFLAHEAALILGIRPVQVQNWTNGRVVKITPRVQARGSGSRNLYNIEDLEKLGIISRLWELGFSAKAIQSVIDDLERGGDWSDRNILWVVARDEKTTCYLLTDRDSLRKNTRGMESWAVVDLELLRRKIHATAKQYLKRQAELESKRLKG